MLSNFKITKYVLLDFLIIFIGCFIASIGVNLFLVNAKLLSKIITNATDGFSTLFTTGSYITASNKKPDMQSQTNIHNVFLFTTINNSITIIEMNDGLYKEYTLPPHPDNMICTLPS